MESARFLGLRVAHSQVSSFAGQRAIVVERYDRRRNPAGDLIRVHQEDMCQSLGISPSAKYQNEGGPAPSQIITLLRLNVSPAGPAEQDVRRFVDALAFNWIIAGTDAHAKNYSVLLSGGQVRLAPLYDVSSALPYEEMYLPKLRMAMKIGGEYRLEAIGGRHWRRFADDNRLDPEAVVNRVGELAERAPAAFAKAARGPGVEELGSDLPGRLVELIERRARWCQEALEPGRYRPN